MPENSNSQALHRYLRTLLRRTALLHIAAGSISFVAAAAWVLVTLMIWLALVGEPGLTAATVVSRTVLVALITLFGYFIVWPLVRMPRIGQLAAEVEKRRDLRELVRAGFEFSNDDSVSERYAPDLVNEVIRQAVDRVAGLEVRFLFLTRKDIALMPVAYGGLIVLLLISIFNPGALMHAGREIVSPSRIAAVEHHANIFAQPGSITVLAGSDVKVSGLDLGRSRDDVTIGYNISEDFWKTEPTVCVEGQGGHVAGEPHFDRYEYTFENLRHTVSYYFEAGGERSETWTITVVHEPILTDLRLRLTPPPYTGEGPLVLEDNGGNVQALEGTHVLVEGRSNNPLAAAWLQFEGKEKEDVEINGREVRFDFTALEDGHYSVLLEDTLGFDTGAPLVYTVEVFQDHAPSIDVLEPGGDTTLPRNRLLDVGFIASDDYGVRSAAILYRIRGETDFKAVNVPLGKERGRKEVATAYRWSLGNVELFPGSYIEYMVQVKDNNIVTGPGVARSKIFRITMPTMAELYDRVKEEEALRSDMMEQAIRDSEEFRERLEKITREFIKTEKMEWTQKKEVDKALEKQQAVEKKLNDIKSSLDQTLKELSENQMTSQEIGEKMEEIRELLEEIDNEDLRKRMEALRKAVEKLDPEAIKKALENLDVSAEEMLEKLERTAELLKQLRKEQKMEELVRKSRDLMDAQKDLNEETAEGDEGSQSEMEKLAQEQDKLADQAKDLQESMEQFSEIMKQDDPQISRQVGEMSQEMKSEQGPQENMEQAAQDLEQARKQQAMEQQQEAMDKMISLFQKASKAQMQMRMNQGQMMAENLQKYARQTLELSKRQEQLARDLQGQQRVDELPDMQNLARDQMSYLRATEKVADEMVKLSGQSLAISPSLLEKLGEALQRMQNSVLFLEQNKPFMSTAHANNAVQSLNEATMEMLKSAKQCSAGQMGQRGGSDGGGWGVVVRSPGRAL
ncbi:MAG: DUF4175 family protein, partial [Candidatus Krumholzibacteriota bacterium]|nr:DUF4175 family protein [Candidatus Krumholzibacteriota bacterium]